MLDFLKFVFARYSLFLSYVAAFLAGVAVVVPLRLMPIFLAIAIVLGSLSAYLRRDRVS